MMKTLFLLFHGFDEANGISKKIHSQTKALRACGMDVRTCYYTVDPDGHRRWKADGEVLVDLGSGAWAKLKKRCCFGSILRYVRREKIGFVYMRSYHNANPFTIHLVGTLRRWGVRVVMEIPTYPYDQEYITPRMKLDLLVDRCFRSQLARQTEGIVTFSNAPTIFGQRTIRLSNGIDFDAIPLRQALGNTPCELHLIGVAEVHYWHGYDRLVRGLAEYYRGGEPTYKVYFHLVGELSGERERQEILPVIDEQGLAPYVILHGARHGTELDALFEQADFAIGSLGRHRSGITHIKTLKNREYAARGLAFAYSETDSDFEQMPYTLKVPADETPVDVEQLIAFQRSVTVTPQTIRQSISHLSWQHQMEKVIAECNLTVTTI